MLQPKKTKFRKMQKGRMRGKAYRGLEGLVRRLRACRRSSLARERSGRSKQLV